MRRYLFFVFLLCALLSCDKVETESSGETIDLSSGGIPISIIEASTVHNDVSHDMSIASKNLCPRDTIFVYTHYVPGKGVIECHIRVAPIYVFGKEGLAGDYYAVTGYAVAHNAMCYDEYEITSSDSHHLPTHFWGWYMKDLGLKFELLTPDGKSVDAEKTSFFINPEPSTTIGSTTYKKGFDVTLSTSLTIGGNVVEEESGDLGWRVLALGNIGVYLNWHNSSTQVLPDQTVELNTDSQHRTVSYHFKSNNDMGGFETKYIPVIFRKDQRVDFSWVWFVKSGNYSAVDYGFKGMKFRATVTPVYYGKAVGRFWDENIKKELSIMSQEFQSPKSSQTWTFDLPGINRIPTGNIKFKNTTRNYVQTIEIYRQGEYKKKKVYCPISGSYSKDQSVNSLIRVGTYDLYYELRNGDTGALIGKYCVSDIKVETGQTTEFSTMDAKKIE